MLKPLHQNVIVEVQEVAKETASGIVLSNTTAPTHVEGVVIAVGTGRLTKEGTLVALTVAPGDKVIFTEYAGMKLTHESKEYVIIPEDDILAVVE